MDDGLSSFVPENLDFDVGSVSHVDVEAQNAADALKREKQVTLPFIIILFEF